MRLTRRERQTVIGVLALVIGLALAVPEVFRLQPYLPRFYVGSFFVVLGLVMLWDS